MLYKKKFLSKLVFLLASALPALSQASWICSPVTDRVPVAVQNDVYTVDLIVSCGYAMGKASYFQPSEVAALFLKAVKATAQQTQLFNGPTGNGFYVQKYETIRNEGSGGNTITTHSIEKITTTQTVVDYAINSIPGTLQGTGMAGYLRDYGIDMRMSSKMVNGIPTAVLTANIKASAQRPWFAPSGFFQTLLSNNIHTIFADRLNANIKDIEPLLLN